MHRREGSAKKNSATVVYSDSNRVVRLTNLANSLIPLRADAEAAPVTNPDQVAEPQADHVADDVSPDLARAVDEPAGATPYSFGQSAHLTAEKSALYKEAAAQIASDLTKAMSNTLVGFTVEAGALIEADAGHDVVEELENYDVASVRFEHRTCASVVTELPLALTLVTGMLGGASFPPGDPRPLTPIERRVLDLLGQTFIDIARDTLLIDDELKLDRSRDGAFAAADDDETDARIGFSFGMDGPGGGGRLILAFDLVTIQQFSDVIDGRLSGRRVVAPVLANPQTALALQPVPVTFSVGMGHIGLTAREIVELQVGDVIRTRLPVASDFVASVGDVDLYNVRLGQTGKQFTAHITHQLTNRELGTIGTHAHPRTIS